MHSSVAVPSGAMSGYTYACCCVDICARVCFEVSGSDCGFGLNLCCC